MIKSARISSCGNYRYSLSRIWDRSQGIVLFIMLNPSTADSDHDDPTVRRCVGFARSWGFGGIVVVNLFAFRSPDPKALLSVEDPIGPGNLVNVQNAALECDLHICAWGNYHVLSRLLKGRPDYKPLRAIKPHYLALSTNGTPMHPLYLKKELKPKPFKGGHVDLVRKQ